MRMVSASIETELSGVGLAMGRPTLRRTAINEQISAYSGRSSERSVSKAVNLSVDTGILFVGVVQGRLMVRRRIIYVHMRMVG